jgi:hypothetical protein
VIRDRRSVHPGTADAQINGLQHPAQRWVWLNAVVEADVVYNSKKLVPIMYNALFFEAA